MSAALDKFRRASMIRASSSIASDIAMVAPELRAELLERVAGELRKVHWQHFTATAMLAAADLYRKDGNEE